MAVYYEGYTEARDKVLKMDEGELLDVLDNLYGRDTLPDDFTLDDLQSEALEQVRREWTDTSSKEYEQVQFWVGLHKQDMTDWREVVSKRS